MKSFLKFGCLCMTLLGCVAEEEGEYSTPTVDGVLFLTDFQSDASSMIPSSADKYASQKYTIGVKESVVPGIDGDKALYFDEPSHFGLTSPIKDNIAPLGEDIVLQYEVRFTESVTCGGAYLKFLDAERFSDPMAFDNDSPYIIMFGPDKCGGTNKVHFILRHENPVSKEWSEHHFNSPPKVKTDKFTHLYTLVIHSDNTFEIKIDDKVETTGSLLEDMTPPINPPEEIDDATDKKPDDWVDEAKINDPEASKPDDWDEDAPKRIPDMSVDKPANWWDDEPEEIPDPTAEEPEDWDEEDDGVWEAPIVKNPKCSNPGCGEWKRPMIDNPDYKGKWQHPQIENPDYDGEWAPKQIKNVNFFVDDSPCDFPAIGAVAIEVMSNFAGTSFDNILIANSAEAASNFASQTYAIKASTEQTKTADRERIKRHEQRVLYLVEGSFMGKVYYYAGEGMEIVRSNPIAAIMTILALVVASIYACCKACCRDDDQILEEDADPTPVNNERELQAKSTEEKNNGADEPDKEDTSEADKQDKEDTSTGDKPDPDVPPEIDEPAADEQSEKKKKKKKKKKKSRKSEKERE